MWVVARAAVTDPNAAAAGFIVDRVGDIARPTANLPISGDLSHLPGPAGAWIAIRRNADRLRHGVRSQVELKQQLGPVYRDYLGPMPNVVVADTKSVAEIARNRDGEWSTALGWRLIADGVSEDSPTMDTPVTLDFGPHREIRQLLRPAFSSESLAQYVRRADEDFSAAARRWGRDGFVRFKPQARTVFARLANNIFLGIDDRRTAERMDQAMGDFWRGPLSPIRKRWFPMFRRAQQGYQTCREILLQRRRQVRERGPGDDMFSQVVAAQRDAWIDDDLVVRLFIGVMSAAFDTTSLGVTSMAYLLATNPAWQDRLRREAAELTPGPLDYEGIKRLVQHDWFWKETLRMYPVANALPRRPVRDVKVLGHRIPAGALVLAGLSATMYDPEVWTDPDRFDPERFGPARNEGRGVFMPFGAGPHVCIGAMLSTMEAVALWRAVLRRHRIRLAAPYRARHHFRPLGVVSGDVALRLEPIR